MYNDNEIIFKDNTAEKIVTNDLNNMFQSSVVFDYTLTEDYLVIASNFPINTRFFKVKTPNDVTSTMKIETWGGNTWNLADRIIDLTTDSGAALAKSGIVSFVIKKYSVWDRTDGDKVYIDGTALSSKGINKKYFMRISFDQTLNALTEISYIGYKFSDDLSLYALYPDLDNQDIRDLFLTAKTDYEEEHILSSIIVTQDLVRKNIILSGQQLFDWTVLNIPATHRTAALIYGKIKGGMLKDRDIAIDDYSKEIDLKFFRVDTNQDGELSTNEQYCQINFAGR